jgi:hypothetical protein
MVARIALDFQTNLPSKTLDYPDKTEDETMGERTEYWWVRYNAETKPAEVGFVGGIPAHIWMIGAADSIPATSAELVERLPLPPQPVFVPQAATPPANQPPARSGSWLWFVGILLLILVAQCSGSLFDALK